MSEQGIQLDGRHSYDDFGMRLVSVYLPMPQPRVTTIQVPGADGSLDLTEVTGRTNYEDRDGVEFTFTIKDSGYSKWFANYSALSNFLHGRKIKVILDDDSNYYYLCRLSVDGAKSNPVLGELTLSGTADPYKYDITSSVEDWIWDSFSFEMGIIRKTKDIQIRPGHSFIDIPAEQVSVAPVFVVTNVDTPLAVLYNGKSFPLRMGNNRFPELRIGKTAVRLNFTGTGILSVDYRGRYL